MSEQPTLERRQPHPEERGRAGFLLRTPYAEGFVEELKRLPVENRLWTGSAWWVAAVHEETVIEVTVRWFDGLRIVNVEGDDEVVDAHGRTTQGRLL